MAKTHTDREYESQLRDLRERILLMAGRVEEMISDSVKALISADTALAEATIKEDQKIDQAEIDVDELCLLVLAKRQPMASDLRLITISMKMVTDLERIGDLAVNICERTLDLGREPHLDIYRDISRMGELVRSMVHDVIDAFVANNAEKAEEVIQRDDQVDALYTKVFRDVLAVMLKDSQAVGQGIHAQSVAKWLERMADHSTNLAEQVIFMVRGKDIRHQFPRFTPKSN